MSFNKYSTFNRLSARQQFQAGREADLEAASATLADAQDSGLAPQTDLLRQIRREKTVSWSGLAALYETADKEFQGALPWNLTLSERDWGKVHRARDKRGSKEFTPSGVSAQDLVGKHARLSGWLKAAAKFRGLRKAIKANVSQRGMNSPRTRLNLWDVASRRPSPGQLDRALWAVKQRADALVSSFRLGAKASWQVLLEVVVYGPRQTCKAAIIAAAKTLMPDEHIRLYRDARNALAGLASAKLRDTSDGVTGYRQAQPFHGEHGMEFFALYVPHGRRFGFKKITLARRIKDGRTYHHDEYTSPEALACETVAAWKQQDQAAAEIGQYQQHLLDYLEGRMTGYYPLLYLEDSHKAGNCQSGTAAWMAGRGWSRREMIPGRELIPFLNDERVVRVVQYCLTADVEALYIPDEFEESRRCHRKVLAELGLLSQAA